MSRINSEERPDRPVWASYSGQSLTVESANRRQRLRPMHMLSGMKKKQTNEGLSLRHVGLSSSATLSAERPAMRPEQTPSEKVLPARDNRASRLRRNPRFTRSVQSRNRCPSRQHAR